MNRKSSPPVFLPYCDESDFTFYSANTNIRSTWPSTVTSLDDTDVHNIEYVESDPVHLSISSGKIDDQVEYKLSTSTSNKNANEKDGYSMSNSDEIIIINSDDDDDNGNRDTRKFFNKPENINESGKELIEQPPIPKITYTKINGEKILVTNDGRKICGIEGCYNIESQEKDNSLVTLFRYPTHDLELNEKWIAFTYKVLKDKSLPSSQACTFICSAHFDQSDLEYDVELEQSDGVKQYKLKEGAFPVIIKKYDIKDNSEHKFIDNRKKSLTPNKDKFMIKETENNSSNKNLLKKKRNFQNEFLSKIAKDVKMNKCMLSTTDTEENPQSANKLVLSVNKFSTICDNVENTSSRKLPSTSTSVSGTTSSTSPTKNVLPDISFPITNKSLEQSISRSSVVNTQSKFKESVSMRFSSISSTLSTIDKRQNLSKYTQTTSNQNELDGITNMVTYYKDEIQKYKKILTDKERTIAQLTKQETIAANRKQQNLQKISQLEEKITALTNRVNSFNEEKRKFVERARSDVKSKLRNTFTENQINLLLGITEKCEWKLQEIFKSYKLKQNSSDDGYLYIVNDMNYPLPSLTTLKHYISNLKIDFKTENNGICRTNFEFMEIFAKMKTDYEKICVLSLNEFTLERLFGLNEDSDEIVSPKNYVQIIICYGLFSNWKQPIYVNYDKQITKTILMNLIEILSKLSYNVVALISDCKKRELWKELQITIKKPYFENIYLKISNSLNIKNIFVFFDSSEILRIMRYWYLKSGFIFKDKTAITKELFIELVENHSVEAEILYGFTQKHLNYNKKYSHQFEIKLAEDMISDNGCNALRELSITNESDVFGFFKCIDDWYQFFSDKKKINLYVGDVEQNLILDRVHEIIKEMRHSTRSKPLNYQKAILISIESLKGLYNNLCNYSTAIPIYKLTLKCAKEFYRSIKLCGIGLMPTAFEFPVLIQKLLLSPILNKPSEYNIDTNQFVIDNEYISVDLLNHYKITLENETIATQINEIKDIDCYEANFKSEDDSFKYIVYWIVKNLKLKIPKLSAADTDVLNIPSEIIEGELVRPSRWWIENAKILENEFILYHRVGLRKKAVLKSLIKILIEKYKTIPNEIIEQFIKQRTIIRLSFLNNNSNSKSLERRKRSIEKLKQNNKLKIDINDELLLPPLQTNDIIEQIIPNEILSNNFIQLNQNNRFLPVIVNLKNGTITTRNTNFSIVENG